MKAPFHIGRQRITPRRPRTPKINPKQSLERVQVAFEAQQISALIDLHMRWPDPWEWRFWRFW